MEQLIALALMQIGGFDVYTSYLSKLDLLFKENPNNDELLFLESLTSKKDIIIHTVSLLDSVQIDRCSFGIVLMSNLYNEYQNVETEIKSFASKVYKLWCNLPQEIASEEPFCILNYADDPLSFGDEKQCRTLYEKAFHYYDNHTNNG